MDTSLFRMHWLKMRWKKAKQKLEKVGTFLKKTDRFIIKTFFRKLSHFDGMERHDTPYRTERVNVLDRSERMKRREEKGTKYVCEML